MKPALFAVSVVATVVSGFGTAAWAQLALTTADRAAETAPMWVNTAEQGTATALESTGAATLFEPGQAAIDTRVGADLLDALPLPRSFTGVVDLSPAAADGQLGDGNLAISGSSGLENRYLVNGADITNPGYGAFGSYSIVYGSQSAGLPLDFLDEVRIRSAGLPAEVGGVLGGVVSLETKHGGDQYHGSLFGNWQPGGMEAERKQVFLSSAPVDIVGHFEEMDGGATLGGPIVPGRLSFFLGFEDQSTSQAFNAPPNLPLAVLGTQYTRKHSYPYLADLTGTLAPGHTLDLSLFGDPGSSDFGPQSTADLVGTSTAGYSSLTFGGDGQALRYRGVLSEAITVEASVARAAESFRQSFPSQNDLPLVIDTRVTPNIITGGVGFYEQSLLGTDIQYHLKLTQVFQGAGRHELSYGIEQDQIDYAESINYTGPSGLTFRDENGVQRTLTTGYMETIFDADNGTPIYRVIRGLFSGQTADTSSLCTGLFIADRYSPIPTLTIDLGLRADQQRIAGGGPNAEGWTFFFADNLAPRLGVSWDFTGQAKGKVFASYGRYVERVPNDLAVREMSVQGNLSFVDFSDPGLTQQIPDGTDPFGGSTQHVATFGTEPVAFAPGTKASYQDEYTAGVLYQAAWATDLGLRYVHRQLGRVLEDYQLGTADDILANPSEFPPWGPPSGIPYNQNFTTYELGNPGSGLNSTCPPNYPNCWVDPRRVYDALELTVERRLSESWQLLASYRFATLIGNYEGFYRTDNGQSDPSISSLFDFPNNTPLMRGQGQSGVLGTDRTHLLKVAGSYRTDFGLLVGATLLVETGTPITELLSHPVYQNQGEVPLGNRGAYGRTPNYDRIDLHLGYPVALRKDLDLRLALDVFNLFDNQQVATVDQFGDLFPGVPSPDFGKTTAYYPPRQVRFGAKLLF